VLMGQMNKAQLHEATTAWQTARVTIEDSFDLRPLEEIPDFRLSITDDELPENNPGIIDNGTIIINTAIPNYKTVLSATVSKLCLESALPSDVLCRECLDDLSFEFARRMIKDNVARKQWDEIWSKHSPRRKISNVSTYYPCPSFRWLYSVAGNKGLDTFIHELAHRAKNHIPLSFEDYMHYFDLRIQRFANALSATELKLVKALIDRPELKVKEISKSIDVSQEWISRKLTQLQKRMILRKFYRAPFSRIGIDMHQILISRRDAESDPFTLIKDCPFLYGYWRVTAGNLAAQATLFIPENKESVEFVKKGLKSVVEAGFNVTIHQTYSAGASFCFDYYVSKLGKWDIPWELLSIHLQRIQLNNLASSMPRIDTPKNRVEIELDDLDMKIITCIWRGIVSVSKIRSELKVGQHKVAKKLQRLRENGLVVKSWEVHNVGLSEHGIVYCKNKKIGDAIAAWSLRLPRTRINFSKDGNLLLIVDVPKGGSFGLASALDGVSNEISVGLLSHLVYGGSGFLGTLWDPKYQRWRCPKKRLETWLSQLD